MKLFIQETGEDKIYLDIVAPTRKQLSEKLGNYYFNMNGETFHINQVLAEKNGDNTALSMAFGGAIGLVGGVAGVIVGGVLGGLLGKDSDKKEEIRVKVFNGSSIQ